MEEQRSILAKSTSQDWKNRSQVGIVGAYTWNDIVETALQVRQDYELFKGGCPETLKIAFFAALCVLHTQPLKGVRTCQAYNLIMATLVTGDVMIFGDWCLYYDLTEQEFVERLKEDKELRLVVMFFDTLYSKLNITGGIINQKALKQYEASRGFGMFLPYQEKAYVSENMSRIKQLENMGEEVISKMLGKKDNGGE